MYMQYTFYMHCIFCLFGIFFKIKFPIDVSVDDHLKEKKATKNELHFCKTKNCCSVPGRRLRRDHHGPFWRRFLRAVRGRVRVCGRHVGLWYDTYLYRVLLQQWD